MTLWEAALAYKGTPWREGGRSKAGVDCVGLVIASCRDVGMDIDPKGQLSRDRRIASGMRMLREFSIMVSANDAQPGDVILIGRQEASHIGILAPGDPLRIIFCPLRGFVTDELRLTDQLGPVRGIFRPCRRSRLD